jgi:hypothetical protein
MLVSISVFILRMYVCTYVYTHVCLQHSVCMFVYIHTWCIHTYIYIHTYAHAYIRRTQFVLCFNNAHKERRAAKQMQSIRACVLIYTHVYTYTYIHKYHNTQYEMCLSKSYRDRQATLYMYIHKYIHIHIKHSTKCVWAKHIETDKLYYTYTYTNTYIYT